jgi:hypothetical protein
LRPNTPTAGPQTREFDLRITDDVMEPSDVTVTEGDRVVLGISTDSPIEVHVHGYDIEKEVEPDKPARLQLRS